MQTIIRDSEDEDEEEFLVAEDHVASKPSQQSNNSWMVHTVDEILAENPSQRSESADQSSLSTGNLQRQIADASRGLFDSTSDQATMRERRPLASSSTPAAKKTRRHSTVVGSGSSAEGVRRTKTANVTYSWSKNARVSDPKHFDAFCDEGPPGTLQANFANHEPTIMFRDTGSTVADNESSQQRMVEQTINQSKQLSNIADQKPVDSDKPDSSPFPWLESSVPTQTPGAIASKRSQPEIVTADGTVPLKLSGSSHTNATADIEVEVPRDARKPSSRAAADGVSADPAVSPERPPPTHSYRAALDADGQSHPHNTQLPPNSSPQVSVPRVRIRSNPQTSTCPDEAPKGRRRKASTAANLEPVNSDDRAIGHPKEMYQPRLSRRRATGLVEQPQDFSIVPEKAAKRRRRTANTASAGPEIADDKLALGLPEAPSTKAVFKSDGSGDISVISGRSATITAVPAMMEKPPPNRGEVRAFLKNLDFPLTNTSFDAGETEEPSPTKYASPLFAKNIPAAAIVGMPPPASPALRTSPTKILSITAATSAMPPPSSSTTRTSRRCHTTIFEDHIDFGGSQQRSPNLRQQQADRNSAVLKEVKNFSTQALKRKRRFIVQDEGEDEDGEDELVKDHVAEVSVPKKRGRPAKQPATKTVKVASADRVLQDSDVESDDQSIVVGPPKKKGRATRAPAAKTAKSAERVLEDSEDDSTKHQSDDDEPPKKKAGGLQSSAIVTAKDDAPASASGAKPNSHRASTASNQPATPPPEKQTPSLTKQDAAIKAPAQSRPAPAVHTPIKTSSQVTHRVGLNRRQRVQPLLRMVRPPAPPLAAPAKKS